MYIIEELAWAIAQEWEEEARQMRRHSQHRPETKPALRSRLARKLVQTGVRLDRAAGESALKAAACSRC